jgi:hypothetical protein
LPLAQWAAAYQINKKFGYVYCDSGWQHLVNIAAEFVLWEMFVRERDNLNVRFRLTDGSANRAKLQASLINRLEVILDNHDVFIRARPLRPVSIPDSELESLAAQFSPFQGAGGWTVNKKSMESFVRQFPVRIQRSLCTALQKMRFLRRESLTSAIERQLFRCSQAIADRNIRVVALSPNSGNFMRILGEADLREKLGERLLIHSHMYGEQLTIRTPSVSHLFRNRTTSTSTSVT